MDNKSHIFKHPQYSLSFKIIDKANFKLNLYIRLKKIKTLYILIAKILAKISSFLLFWNLQ